MVESIPDNITFEEGSDQWRRTYDAWTTLIESAQHRIDIAAYKSSLRGKHVLPEHEIRNAKLVACIDVLRFSVKYLVKNFWDNTAQNVLSIVHPLHIGLWSLSSVLSPPMRMLSLLNS